MPFVHDAHGAPTENSDNAVRTESFPGNWRGCNRAIGPAGKRCDEVDEDGVFLRARDGSPTGASRGGIGRLRDERQALLTSIEMGFEPGNVFYGQLSLNEHRDVRFVGTGHGGGVSLQASARTAGALANQRDLPRGKRTLRDNIALIVPLGKAPPPPSALALRLASGVALEGLQLRRAFRSGS